MPKYTARKKQNIENIREDGRKAWNSQELEVIDAKGNVCGSWVYNYHSGIRFYPFIKDGKDYALYARDYTATRVMSLPDCTDLGGEEPAGFGFCPVWYFVPEERVIGQHREIWNTDDTRAASWAGSGVELREGQYDKMVDTFKYKNFHGQWGFVAGCVWGDGGGWKLQLLDLRNIEKGEVRRVYSFDNHELPSDVNSIEECLEYLELDNRDFSINIRCEHKYYTFDESDFDL